VVETGITSEVLGICVRRGDDALRGAINEAQRALLKDGTLPHLVTKWLGQDGALATPE
jgi:polar amino acid transport system substrate-binding protein